MTNEELRTISAMRDCGGNFVQTLAVAYLAADSENRIKIRSTWPEYWKQYQEISATKRYQSIFEARKP